MNHSLCMSRIMHGEGDNTVGVGDNWDTGYRTLVRRMALALPLVWVKMGILLKWAFLKDKEHCNQTLSNLLPSLPANVQPSALSASNKVGMHAAAPELESHISVVAGHTWGVKEVRDLLYKMQRPAIAPKVRFPNFLPAP
jgi:hypothetical protein